jgi:hypothetical protein
MAPVRLSGTRVLFTFHGSATVQIAGRVLSGGGATGTPYGRRRFLTSAKYAEMLRRKRADLTTKLWQMTAAERERR